VVFDINGREERQPEGRRGGGGEHAVVVISNTDKTGSNSSA